MTGLAVRLEGGAACARCATLQRTCCQRAEVVVTTGDLGRIAGHVGRDDFWELRAPLDQAYVEADDDDPNWLAYTVTADGRRRVLRRQANGDCTFLGAQGCVLPLAVRPLVCRLYPYAFNERGLDGLDAEYCPRAELAPDGRPMNEVLAISRDDAEAWRVRLYEELRDDHS